MIGATRCAQVRMNGDAALRVARAAGAAVPIAAVTANATPEDAERYRAEGFSGVLAKPFTAEQMHALLAGLLQPAAGGR